MVGEALVDVVTTSDGTTEEHPGGSGANVAVALGRLGRPVRYAASYADDARGRSLAAHLAASGVTMACDPHVLDHTSTAQATITEDGSATYVFDLEWKLGEIAVGTPRFVHVGSLAPVLSPGAESVFELLDGLPESARVLYDINMRPTLTGTGEEVAERIERAAAYADVVKASDEDLETLYPGIGLEKAAERLLGLGAGAVAVTRGGDGASWITADGRVDVGAEEVTVVDTIGAGDTFSAGLVDALWDDFDRDRREVLAHGVRAAAVTVSRAGANPPTRAELEG
ncbi:ribokinase [Nocardioides luteus]|uniref:Ribokinase n=1 Tax=Nocardioides luteus TaxID=1844 RepID=A0ABQ5SSY7_9ACTN|nr:ribokinase [Nocardioides luteus]GLJ66919.1 ribokinase [Nocardioides luteus]